jgi:hypothetical protein
VQDDEQIQTMSEAVFLLLFGAHLDTLFIVKEKFFVSIVTSCLSTQLEPAQFVRT